MLHFLKKNTAEVGLKSFGTPLLAENEHAYYKYQKIITWLSTNITESTEYKAS